MKIERQPQQIIKRNAIQDKENNNPNKQNSKNEYLNNKYRRHSRHSRTFSIVSADNLDEIIKEIKDEPLMNITHKKTKSIKLLLQSKNLKHMNIDEINQEHEACEENVNNLNNFEDSLDMIRDNQNADNEEDNEKHVLVQNLITPKKTEINSHFKSKCNLINNLNQTESYKLCLQSMSSVPEDIKPCEEEENNNSNLNKYNIDKLSCTIINEDADEFINNSAYSIHKKSNFHGTSSSISDTDTKKMMICNQQEMLFGSSINSHLPKKTISETKNLKELNLNKESFQINEFDKKDKERRKIKSLCNLTFKSIISIKPIYSAIKKEKEYNSKLKKESKDIKEIRISKDKKLASFSINGNLSLLERLNNIENKNKGVKIIKNKKLPDFTIQTMRMIPDK